MVKFQAAVRLGLLATALGMQGASAATSQAVPAPDETEAANPQPGEEGPVIPGPSTREQNTPREVFSSSQTAKEGCEGRGLTAEMKEACEKRQTAKLRESEVPDDNSKRSTSAE